MDAKNYTGTLDCFAKILKAEGIAGFYRVRVSKLLHFSATVIAVTTCFWSCVRSKRNLPCGRSSSATNAPSRVCRRRSLARANDS
jgi:hypothetical protein